MKIRFVDAHCHLQFDSYASDRHEIIARMQERGIAGIVVGVDRASSERAVALAEAHEHLFAAVGLHPNYAGTEAFNADAFRRLAAHPKVVAIGECGLDNFRPAEITVQLQHTQREVLYAHLALAAELDKPLIIHARPTRGTQDAYEDLAELLTEARRTYPNLRGDTHFFVGGLKEAQALFALDFTISFTAVVTFARDYDAVIRAAPPDRILAETDSPYVAPVARRGTRNDPLAVEDVAAQIAVIRGEDADETRIVLARNACRIFGLPQEV